MRPRFSIATSMFGLPIRACLKKIGQVPELEAVKIDLRHELRPAEMTETGRREFLHLLKELGLQISAFSFSLRRALYDEVELDRRIHAIQEAMTFSSAMKVRHLCLRVGRIPSEADSRDFGLLTETLNDLAQLGNRIGVVLCPIVGGEPSADVENLLRKITAGPIGIEFDPARIISGPTAPPQMLRSLHRYVEQFTVRDAVRDFSGGTDETSLGRGEVVWDELLATLAEADYRGWLTLQKNPSENALEETERSIRYLKHILGEF